MRGFEVEVDEEAAKRILAEFPSARVDARGFLEDLPVAFRSALFEAIVETKSIGKEAFQRMFEKIGKLNKPLRRRRSTYLHPLN